MKNRGLNIRIRLVDLFSYDDSLEKLVGKLIFRKKSMSKRLDKRRIRTKCK